MTVRSLAHEALRASIGLITVILIGGIVPVVAVALLAQVA